MRYQSETKDFAFLYDFWRSPILGCLKSVLRGDLDVYLWSLFRGVAGRPPQPGLAVLFFLLWAAGFAFAAVGLRRVLNSSRGVASPESGAEAR